MKKRFYLGYLIISSCCLLLQSCVDIIEFDTERDGGQLVVDGKIVAGAKEQVLLLGKTASTNRKTMPVDGARITIMDNDGNLGQYNQSEEGRYELSAASFSVEIGGTYWIEIQLADGPTYQSRKETVQPVTGSLDSIRFDFELIEELNAYSNPLVIPVVHAYVDVTLEQNAGRSAFFRFDVEEVYRLSPTDFPDPFGAIPPACYIYTRPDMSTFELLNITGDRTRTVNNLRVATAQLDHRFDEKHYFNVYLRSLTEGAYTFWEQVDQTVSSVGTIFDTPPAPIRGNIFNVDDPDENVLGYFSAVASDTIRAFLLPSDTPYLPFNECRYSSGKSDYAPRCRNCLSEHGATLIKPDYF